ncbi:hypothetical protein K2173_006706 [Erythroxylum novogranatense]|uniref:DUF4219 domain-containing protein n=1 Tax=Erythroxylum novogranatense TaxID=1862640 RepID=A0AAV8TF61_9ROSI|nr:hypothetical protein K2173_006706 [Erythroxylum novogranatense]
MEGESSFSAMAPAVFDGEDYQVWAVKMEAYLDACDLWEAVEEDYEVYPLPGNPTMAQIKTHKERRTRKSKAKACLFAAVSSAIFSRIMSFGSAKAIWDFHKNEYQGDERIRGMKVLNLVREFEMQHMKESETIKAYVERLFGIANKVRILGAELTDNRIVQKILVSLPERYEATIASLENTKDLSKISLTELLSALQAQEQRRMMRQEGTTEGALQAKWQQNFGDKNKKWKGKKRSAGGSENAANESNSNISNKGGKHPPCQHCGKRNHPHYKCWRKPDMQCRKCKRFGHAEIICKEKETQQQGEAQIATQQEPEQLFVASCFASKISSDCWLVDSGCTNHMTNDEKLFKELDKSASSRVRIGNGDYITVKGKGTVAIESLTGTKLISEVLYVPEIDQNLLSVGQLLEKGFKVLFEDKMCLVIDQSSQELFRIKMQGKSFSLNPLEEEQVAFPCQLTTADTWHKRMGHFHNQALLFMQRNEMVRGLPNLEEHLTSCKACMLGEQI